MRIVSGRLRGRNIATPSGRNTRPTSDQTRESLFNILGHADWAPDLDGAIVADIFAGSGALGLEAISRGAEFCLFVETEPKARAAIRSNIEKMNLFGCTRLHRQDATRLRLITENSVIILEVAADEEVDLSIYRVLDERNWGAAKVLFLKPS